MWILTTIDANEIPANDEKFIRRDIFGKDHGGGGDDSNNVIDQQAAFSSKSIGNPASYESPAHPTDGEYRDSHGIHECWGFVRHIFTKISLSMGFADKLLNDLKCWINIFNVLNIIRNLQQNFAILVKFD